MLQGLTSLRGGRRSFTRASGPDVACTQPSAATQAIYVGHAAVFRGTSAGATKVEVFDGATLVATAVGTTTWAATVTETAGRETSARTYTIRATDAGGATKDVTVTVVVESKVQGHVAKICARYANKIERCCTPETDSYLTDGEGVTRWYDTSRKGIVMTDGIRTTAGTLNGKHFSQDTDAAQPTTATVNGDVVLTNRDLDEYMTGTGCAYLSSAWTYALQCAHGSVSASACVTMAEVGGGGDNGTCFDLCVDANTTDAYVRQLDNVVPTYKVKFGVSATSQRLLACAWTGSALYARMNGADGTPPGGAPPSPVQPTSQNTTNLFRLGVAGYAGRVPAGSTIGLVLWASQAIAAADLTTNGWLDNELKSMLGTY